VKIYTSGGQFFADGFAIRRSFSLEEGESRLVSYVSGTGCGAATLTAERGELLVYGRIGVIRWQWGAELFPLPTLRPWEERAELDIPDLSEPAHACVRCGVLDEIVITGAVRYTHALACPIYAPKLSLIAGQRAPIVRLDAACEEGAYVAFFSLVDGRVNRLLEGYGDSVLCEGNEVRIERSYRDMLSRRATLRYLWQGDRFECSREIVCANEHTFIREEKGRALLEAAMARDQSGVASLLSPEIGDVDALLEYFGEILMVRPALGSDSPTAAATVTRGSKGLVATTYEFEFDEKDRIINLKNDA